MSEEICKDCLRNPARLHDRCGNCLPTYKLKSELVAAKAKITALESKLALAKEALRHVVDSSEFEDAIYCDAKDALADMENK